MTFNNDFEFFFHFFQPEPEIFQINLVKLVLIFWKLDLSEWEMNRNRTGLKKNWLQKTKKFSGQHQKFL